MKLLLTFSLITFISSSLSAQQPYTYLKGQTSPFNGVFSEPRYTGVDSISYIRLVGNGFAEQPSSDEIMSSEKEGYTLLKSSSDGLSDTLRYYEANTYDIKVFVKRYADDGTLVYDSSVVVYSGSPNLVVNEYRYDAENRISEISTIRNHYLDAEVLVYDTTQYDYTFKPYQASFLALYLDSESLGYNTVYTKSGITGKEDSILVFYNDSGYNTYQYFPPNLSLSEIIHTVEYVFDAQNRLKTCRRGYIEMLNEKRGVTTYIYKPPVTIEYKYTDNGYEEYSDNVKEKTYTFQEDGFCTEIITYKYYLTTVYPPEIYVASIEQFSYFKDGDVISANEPMEQKIPEIYGIQGGIVVNTEKSLPVNIYTFSGSLVKSVTVAEGSHILPVSKGFYVVSIGNMSYKIRVR